MRSSRSRSSSVWSKALRHATSLVSAVARRGLEDGAADAGTFVADDAGAVPVADGPAIDFDGWDVEDTAYWRALSAGTCGISGHRTTYGAPFFRIDELTPGDIIDLYSPFRRYRYHVIESLVVTPDQIEVVAPTEEPLLTLTACHPPYSARYRLAVRARLVEVRRIEDTGQ